MSTPPPLPQSSSRRHSPDREFIRRRFASEVAATVDHPRDRVGDGMLIGLLVVMAATIVLLPKALHFWRGWCLATLSAPVAREFAARAVPVMGVPLVVT